MTLSDERVEALLRQAAEPTERESQRAHGAVRSDAGRRRARPALAAVTAAACVLLLVGLIVIAEQRGPASKGGNDRLRATNPASASPTASGAVATLVGRRWVPAGSAPNDHPTKAYILFSADGTWAGSDGCNAFGGTYRYDRSGRFSAVITGSTLAYCNVPHIDSWVAQAKHANVSGNELRLTSTDGQLLGTLTS
jgi:heat shock protein HslJ